MVVTGAANPCLRDEADQLLQFHLVNTGLAK